MTNYEVFKAATPDKLAVLLTSLVAGLLEDPEPGEIQEYYKALREMLDKEAI